MTATAGSPADMRMSQLLWRATQGAGLGVTASLIAALIAIPDLALAVLWNAAIPVLPATFLIAPAIWRNMCPLATLNVMTNRFGTRRALTARLMPVAGSAGIVLLALLVPARRFLFNTNGEALAIVIVAVAGLALTMGALFDMKAGFCNALCPVLPVERLYGQAPLAAVQNARCSSCTLCTARGCIDLAPAKSIPQILGRARRSHAWLQSGYGVFAAAFPGFVIGYFHTQDGSLSSAGYVYATVAAWTLAGYLVTQIVVRGLRLDAAQAVRFLAASAIVLYYWYVAPVLMEAWTWPAWTTAAIRMAGLALVAWWLWRNGQRGPNRMIVSPAAA